MDVSRERMFWQSILHFTPDGTVAMSASLRNITAAKTLGNLMAPFRMND
jgi:hypothetical protein